MGKTVKKPPAKETLSDEFNELDCRGRSVVSEEIVLHDLGETKTDSGSVFAGEARVVFHLEDGRTLNKVFDLEFDAEDVS